MFRIHERRRNVEPEPAQARRPDGREQRRLGLEPGSKIREPLPHEIFTGGSVASHAVIIERYLSRSGISAMT